ncbi:hypothetical protein H4R35_003260 [Dimargaris xerosporica]|nr:hypothetical protein H4R35_003260 [Dimargaris xerosporica]
MASGTGPSRTKVSVGEAVRSTLCGVPVSSSTEAALPSMVSIRLSKEALRLLTTSGAPQASIQFGTANTLVIGDQRFEFHRVNADTQVNQVYRRTTANTPTQAPTQTRTTSGVPSFDLAGQITHKLALPVRMDASLKERLKYKTQEAGRDRSARQSVLLDDKEALNMNRASRVPARRPAAKPLCSRPTAAHAVDVTNGKSHLTSPTGLAPPATGGIPLRTRLIQLLACQASSLDSLVGKVKAKRDDICQLLPQIAGPVTPPQGPRSSSYPGPGSAHSAWKLLPATYCEVKVHDWGQYSARERDEVIKHATQAFDLLKLPKDAPERTRLIPPNKPIGFNHRFPTMPGATTYNRTLPEPADAALITRKSPLTPTTTSATPTSTPLATVSARKRKTNGPAHSSTAEKLAKASARGSRRPASSATTYSARVENRSTKKETIKPILPKVSVTEYQQTPTTKELASTTRTRSRETAEPKASDLAHFPAQATLSPKATKTSGGGPTGGSLSARTDSTPITKKRKTSTSQFVRSSPALDDAAVSDTGRQRRTAPTTQPRDKPQAVPGKGDMGSPAARRSPAAESKALSERPRGRGTKSAAATESDGYRIPKRKPVSKSAGLSETPDPWTAKGSPAGHSASRDRHTPLQQQQQGSVHDTRPLSSTGSQTSSSCTDSPFGHSQPSTGPGQPLGRSYSAGSRLDALDLTVRPVITLEDFEALQQTFHQVYPEYTLLHQRIKRRQANIERLAQLMSSHPAYYQSQHSRENGPANIDPSIARQIEQLLSETQQDEQEELGRLASSPAASAEASGRDAAPISAVWARRYGRFHEFIKRAKQELTRAHAELSQAHTRPSPSKGKQAANRSSHTTTALVR